MNEETQVETEEVVPTATQEETEQESSEPSQDPVADELARVTERNQGRTKKDKLLYTKQRVESQLAELEAEEGGNIESVSVDKSAPMTVAMYEQLQRDQAQKTALQMADDITDASDRELTKYHIEHTIKASGNPSEDLRMARAIVSSVKNGLIAQEVSRTKTAPKHGTGTGAPARTTERAVELTLEEQYYMKPPFNMTKEQVLAARKK